MARSNNASLPQTIVAATWNIRYGWGNRPDAPREFEHVLRDVRTLLTESKKPSLDNVDLPEEWVLGLQEVLIPTDEPSLAERLAEALGCDFRLMALTDNYDPEEKHENYSGGGWGVAILTNMAIRDGRTNKTIAGSEKADMPYLGQAPGDYIERHALNIPLETKTGEAFNFQVAHPTPHPLHAAKQYNKFLARAHGQGKTISAADSNTFRFLARKSARRHRQKIVSPAGPTWPLRVFFQAARTKNGEPDGRKATPMPVPLFGLDNIAVPRETKITRRSKHRLGSDHIGLRVVLTTKQPKAKTIRNLFARKRYKKNSTTPQGAAAPIDRKTGLSW